MTLTDFYLGGFAHPTTEETTVTTATYKLTARDDSGSETVNVTAESDALSSITADLDDQMSVIEALDFDATLTAIPLVMDKAYSNPLWAKGHITLARPDGTVIHEMEAK